MVPFSAILAVVVPDVEPMLAGHGLPVWDDNAWVEPKIGWRARLVVDPELPDGFVVRTRSGRRLELPELRPPPAASC